LASPQNYLIFHTLAEIFSILIAFSIFAFAWNSRQFLEDNYLLFLGIAYLFVGGLDLVHTFSYPGITLLREGGSTLLASQLWISARCMESASLLLMGLLVGRRIKPAPVFTAYALVWTSFILMIFVWPIFPVTYVEGTGLTPFKKVSEYLISLVLLGALALLRRKRSALDRTVYNLLAASILVTVYSELSFTLYKGPYELFNLLGHYLKIISFYLIYRAIIQTGLVQPFGLLFRNLKESENSLRNQTAQLEAVLKQMPAGVAIVSARARKLILANRQMNRIWRGSFPRSGDIFQSTDVKLFRPDGGPYETSDWPLERALSTGEAVADEEVEIQRADGSYGTLLVSSAPVRSTDGRIMAGILTFHDITARKRMEDALRRAREELEKTRDRYASLYDFAPVGYLTFDRNGLILEANLTIAAMLGVQRSDLVNSSLASHVDEADRDAFGLHSQRLFEADTHQLLETQLLRQDGSKSWALLESMPVRDAQGNIFQCRTAVTDISELKQAERDLQESEAKYRALVEQVPAINYTAALDEARTTVYISPQVEIVLGFPEEDWQADPDLWRKQLHLDDRERVLAARKTPRFPPVRWCLPCRRRSPSDGLRRRWCRAWWAP